MTWKELSRDEQGDHGMPGSQYHIETAIVSVSDTNRYKVAVLDRRGSNQGYLEEHDRTDRQYRADSLDELMRIAISAEKERDEVDQNIITAIREAIYAAEESEELPPS